MSDAAWVIEFSAAQLTQQIRMKDTVIVGRADTEGVYKPDIDLGPHGGEEKGVSRRHLKLSIDDSKLMVTDLQSNNGTLLNGERLEPDKPYPVKHEDKLQLGHMMAEIRIVVSPKSAETTSEPQDEDESGKGQPLLIVEDEDEVANILSLIMSRIGYEPHISHDVIGAIRIFNQKHPVAVILDLMLPDMNGLEFCRYVRRDVERNQTPVVIVSAVKTEQNIAQALDAGADIFLGKPISAAELQQAVKNVIENRPTEKRGETPMMTRHLPGTAPLQAIAPESRRNAAVLFIANHTEAPITLTVGDTVSFGRSSPSKSGRQHIDLSRYGAVDQGVSRIHAFLHRKDGTFFVEDNDSVNGTYLNGYPLDPKTPTTLNNADEIRLGQLRMYIYFLTDKDFVGE